MVSPPDAQGYCSLGPSVGGAITAIDEATTVIAQINRGLPRTQGQSFIHSIRIGWFIDQDQVPVPLPMPQFTPLQRRIGEYAAQFIEDGSTLQASLAAAPQAVLEALADHRRLGLHTPVLSPACMTLILTGAADNSRKTLDPGISVCSWIAGGEDVHLFADGNPHVHLHPIDYVSHPGTLLRQQRLLAINSASAVDLTGYAGFVPGQLERLGAETDFMDAAGSTPVVRRSLPCPPRWGRVKGRRSLIVASLDMAGGAGRAEAHHVVTEFGVASLRGRSVRQRAMELIQIAHPDFREGLLRQAREAGILSASFNLPPPYEPPGGRIASRAVTLRDGRRYLLRPLKPSDDHRSSASSTRTARTPSTAATVSPSHG
jgi:acyl-CoA hydrolase